MLYNSAQSLTQLLLTLFPKRDNGKNMNIYIIPYIEQFSSIICTDSLHNMRNTFILFNIPHCSTNDGSVEMLIFEYFVMKNIKQNCIIFQNYIILQLYISTMWDISLRPRDKTQETIFSITPFTLFLIG